MIVHRAIMRAVPCRGPGEKRPGRRPDPKVQVDTDAIVEKRREGPNDDFPDAASA